MTITLNIKYELTSIICEILEIIIITIKIIIKRTHMLQDSIAAKQFSQTLLRSR
jgi:hypothetical protein